MKAEEDKPIDSTPRLPFAAAPFHRLRAMSQTAAEISDLVTGSGHPTGKVAV